MGVQLYQHVHQLLQIDQFFFLGKQMLQLVKYFLQLKQPLLHTGFQRKWKGLQLEQVLFHVHQLLQDRNQLLLLQLLLKFLLLESQLLVQVVKCLLQLIHF